TNAGRVLGRGWGLLVFALDGLKGLVPAWVAGQVIHRVIWPETGSPESPGAAGLWVGVGAAAILGHMYPVYLRFKGGKGVATSLGALLGIYPYFTLPVGLAFGLWVVLTLL